MVLAEALQRGNQRSGITRGPQPQIDFVHIAFAGARFQDRDQLLHDAWRGFPLGAGLRLVAIDENQVQVGIVRHLTRTQPAHRDRAQRQLRGDRKAAGNLGAGHVERLVEHGFSQQGQFGLHVFQLEPSREVGDRDAHKLLMAEVAQRI
jgi:hypothetical protein